MVMQKLLGMGEAELAVKLVEDANGLGLGFAGTGSLQRVLVALSTEGKLAHVTRCLPPPHRFLPATAHASSLPSLSHMFLSFSFQHLVSLLCRFYS